MPYDFNLTALKNNSPQVFIGLFVLSLLTVCGQSTPQNHLKQSLTQPQPDNCDGPDADISCSFVNIPKNISHIMTISGPEEPGERLLISGTIYKADEKTPFPNVLLYAYHTDDKGVYAKKGNEAGVQKWHGRLHGWLKTDRKGYYEIRSIRPARYPGNTMMAHIHAAVKPDGGQPFYINDYVFKDDSLVTEQYLSRLVNSTGGTGVVDVQKKSNVWTGKRDIILKK